MKQVIIRIQDNKGKTLQRFSYWNYSQFNDWAYKEVSNSLKEGLTAYIKVGNQYSCYIDYENCEQDLKDYPNDFENIKEVITNEIRFRAEYYVKDYLPRY